MLFWSTGSFKREIIICCHRGLTDGIFLWWDVEGLALQYLGKGMHLNGFDVLAIPHKAKQGYKLIIINK